MTLEQSGTLFGPNLILIVNYLFAFDVSFFESAKLMCQENVSFGALFKNCQEFQDPVAHQCGITHSPGYTLIWLGN